MNTLFFTYVPGNSIVHRLDPRVKIAGMLIASISIFISSSLWEMALVAFVLFLLALISSISVRVILSAVRPMLMFLSIIFILQLFLTEGDPLFSLMGLDATHEGLALGVLMSMRFIFLLMFASLLTATTAPSLMTTGIEMMLRPLPLKRLGISSFDLATMMFLSLHFVPLIYGSFSHLRDAQVSRGLDMTRNPFKAVYSLSVPMIRTAFTSAEEVAVAMESRCYQGVSRSSLDEPVMKKNDLAALLIFGIIMFLLV